MMTKKDFIALAEALKNTRPGGYIPIAFEQWSEDVLVVTTVLGGNNSRFNSQKFMEAVNGK